jgi:hypothetical protein
MAPASRNTRMTCMRIFDDVFEWEGFGGKLKLASGRCRLRIFDLNRSHRGGVMHLRPMVVVAADLPQDGMLKGQVTVRSANSHIATQVSRRFRIPPQRMLFVEYTPAETYGPRGEYRIAAVLDAVDFTWQDGLALYPRRRALEPPLRDLIQGLVQGPTAPDDAG